MLVALLLSSALGADHTVAISANKLRYPGFDVEYEHRLNDNMSLVGFAGLGRYTPLLLELAEQEMKKKIPVKVPPLDYKAAGVRYHWMPFGSFEQGIFVGGSARWMHLSASKKQTQKVTESNSGASADVDQNTTFNLQTIMAGPHIGYKLTLGPGVTLSALVGPGYTFAKGKGVTRTASSGVAADQIVNVQSTGPYPYGTMLAGWTF